MKQKVTHIGTKRESSLDVTPIELLNICLEEITEDPKVKSMVIVFVSEESDVNKITTLRANVRWEREIAMLSQSLHAALERK